MNEKRFPASEAHRLDDPARAEWLAPSDLLSALNLHAGQTVADVGAGTGYISLPFAQFVGLKGKVYAVDAQAGMLSLLQQKIDKYHLSNVIPIQAEAQQTGLSASCCGLFFMANVWHEIEDRNAVLGEALRVLEPGGRMRFSIGDRMSNPSTALPSPIESMYRAPWRTCDPQVSHRSSVPKWAGIHGSLKGRN